MKITAQVKNKRFVFDNKALQNWAFYAKDGSYTIEIKKQTRTSAQNRALHLFFTQLADTFNEKGVDMRVLIREEVEIAWTPVSIKEYLWKPLQKIITGKHSTMKLDKSKEINLIYDNLNRIIIERTKGEVWLPPFPSLEEVAKKMLC